MGSRYNSDSKAAGQHWVSGGRVKQDQAAREEGFGGGGGGENRAFGFRFVPQGRSKTDHCACSVALLWLGSFRKCLTARGQRGLLPCLGRVFFAFSTAPIYKEVRNSLLSASCRCCFQKKKEEEGSFVSFLVLCS